MSAYLPLTVSTGLGLILTPIFVNALSRDDFGLWSVGLGLVAYLGILDAGVGTAIATRTGYSVDDEAEVARIARTATVIYAIMGVACVAIGLGFAAGAPALIGLGENQSVDQARLMIALLAFWQAFNMVSIVPSGLLQGSGHFSSFAIFGALAALWMGVSQAVAAVATHEVAWIAAATALGGLVSFSLLHLRAKSKVRGYSLSPRGGDRATAKSLYRLGWRNALLFIAGSAGYGSDVLIVGFVVGAEGAATYAIASRAGQFAITLGTRAPASMTGSYATLAGMNSHDRVWSLYLKGIQVSLLVYLPLAASLVIFGDELLALWVGDTGRDSYPVLVAIVASGLFQVVGHNAFVMIVATERGDQIVRLSLASGVFNVVISVVLTRELGPSGAAIGSLVTAALVDGMRLPLVVAKLCSTRVRNVLPPVAAAVPPLALCVATGLAVRSGLGASGTVAILGSFMVVLAFFVGCAASRSQRSTLAQLLRRTP